MDDFCNVMASLVKFHRKKAKLTQAQLATFANIGKTSVFDIEHGKKTVKLETLLAVLHVLNIKIKFQGPLIHLFEEHQKSKSIR